MCQNDDRIPENPYAIDEFNAKELFGELPHPETLNLYFVGTNDGNFGTQGVHHPPILEGCDQATD